jgi:hypothetical protein
MLYISESEKRHIKSLYYGKLIGEQSTYYSPNSPLQQPPSKDDLLAAYNSIASRYDVNTSDGIHNLLDDAQLATAFATAGAVDNYIGILHSFYWFYEGATASSNDEEKTKKFILGVVDLVLAIPGITELSALSKWRNTLRTLPAVETIGKVNSMLTPFWTKIDSTYKTASSTLNKIYNFLLERKLDLLANLCKIIIQKLDDLNVWFVKMVEYLKSVGGKTIKGIESTANVYFTDKKTDTAKSTLSDLMNVPGGATPNELDLTPGNTRPQPQDSTDPAHYMPKKDPKQGGSPKIKPN